MQKSRLGISVGVVGAAAYLLPLFGGYVAALLLVGYVLLLESSGWLKRTALKAMVLTFLFSLANLALGLLPDLIGIISSFVGVFGGHFYLSPVTSLCIGLQSLLSLTKTILMVALALRALKNRTIIIGFIDQLVNKCVE